MRSSPLLLLLLVILGFGALAVPLTRLTQDAPGTTPVRVPQTTGAPITTLVRVRFAHQPVRVSLKQGDRVIAALSAPSENPTELTASLVLPEETVELVVEGSWPPSTPPTALTIELEPDGLEARSATWWTDSGSLTEVFGFSWR